MTKNSFCLCSCTRIPQKRRPRHTPLLANDTRFLHYGLIGLFTENPETVTIGITALHIISLGFILSAVSVTSSGALEALGQGMASLVISVMRYVAVIIPVAFVLSRLIGVTGVWWAFVCTESVTAMVAYVLYRKVWKRA